MLMVIESLLLLVVHVFLYLYIWLNVHKMMFTCVSYHIQSKLFHLDVRPQNKNFHNQTYTYDATKFVSGTLSVLVELPRKSGKNRPLRFITFIRNVQLWSKLIHFIYLFEWPKESQCFFFIIRLFVCLSFVCFFLLATLKSRYEISLISSFRMDLIWYFDFVDLIFACKY